MKLYNPFLCDRGWWSFDLGRFAARWDPSPFHLPGIHVDGPPGIWRLSIGAFQFSWRRKWIVWGDVPYRAENIRLYDQFGTFTKEVRDG